MEVTYREQNGIYIVTARGELDLSSAPLMRAEFDKVIEKRAAVVLVDFAEVTYIDSSGLATIIDALQRTKKYKARLALCGLNQVVRNVLEIARLDSVFTIFPDEQTALQKLQG